MQVAGDRRLGPERPDRQIRLDRKYLQAPQEGGDLLRFGQDRAEAATLRDRDRAERKDDLRSIKAHHYLVIGFIVALFVAHLTIV